MAILFICGHCSCLDHIVLQGAKQLGLHATDEVGNTTVDDLASYSIHQKKRIFGKSDKEIEKNMDLISLKNDAEITRHHNMVQVSLFSGSLKPKYYNSN